MVDLVEEGFDLALRVGSTGSQNVVAKQIGQTQLLYAAAPDYLKITTFKSSLMIY